MSIHRLLGGGDARTPDKVVALRVDCDVAPSFAESVAGG